jgi:hypothetical protein
MGHSASSLKARNLEELESWINRGLPSRAKELRLLRKLASAACDPRVSLSGATPANIILAHAATEYMEAITPVAKGK